MMREFSVEVPMAWIGMQEPLTRTQVQHIIRLDEALCLRSASGCWWGTYPVAIDRSGMGCGKTRAAQGLARRLGLPVFVVRPGTVNTWEAEAECTGVEFVESISYAGLASTPGTAAPAHRWLTRREVPIHAGEPQGKTRAVFTATPEWVERVKQGVLLVADEAQHLKNKSDKSAAVQELIRVVVDPWTKSRYSSSSSVSRVLLLSGSLFDKPEHATRMCEVMGLLPAGERDPQRAWECSLLKHCLGEQGRSADEVGSNWPAFEKFVYDYFISVVKPSITSCMPPPVIEANKDSAVGFFRMDEAGTQEMSGALDDLREGMEETGEGGGLGAITKAIMRAHRAKVGVAVRLVSKWLESNPLAQAVVFGAYDESLESIAEKLQSFSPQLLTGKVRKADRNEMLALFQSGERRLMVANTAVGGVGVNMHDVHGGRPRRLYLLPTYFATDMYQALGRCYRLGVRSDVVQRLIFAHGAAEELQLLNNLARKSKVWRDLMPEELQEKKGFLADLPQVEELEDGTEVPRGQAHEMVERCTCEDPECTVRDDTHVRCVKCQAVEGSPEADEACRGMELE